MRLSLVAHDRAASRDRGRAPLDLVGRLVAKALLRLFAFLLAVGAWACVRRFGRARAGAAALCRPGARPWPLNLFDGGGAMIDLFDRPARGAKRRPRKAVPRAPP